MPLLKVPGKFRTEPKIAMSSESYIYGLSGAADV